MVERHRTRSGFELLVWTFVLWLPATRLPIAMAPLILLIATLPYLVLIVQRGSVPRPLVWLAAIVVYQLASAIIFGMSLSNFLQFDFYRRDAKFLFAYAPMVVAGTLGLGLETVIRQLKAMVVIVAVISGAGLVEYVLALQGLHLNLLVNTGPGGLLYFSALATSHNAAASICSVAAVLTFGQLLSGTWRGTRWWVALGVLLSGVTMTLSRSFVVATAVVFLVAIIVWGSRRWLLAAIVVVAFGGALIGRDVGRRFVELRDPTEVRNVVVRLGYWERAINDIRRSPWLGIGFSRFNDVPVRRFDGWSGLVQWKVGAPTVNDDAHAHNGLLMVWAETGLLGVFLWAMFLGTLTADARRRYRERGPPEQQGLARGVVMALGVLLLASVVANNIVAPSAVWPAGFFAGALLLLPISSGAGGPSAVTVAPHQVAGEQTD